MNNKKQKHTLNFITCFYIILTIFIILFLVGFFGSAFYLRHKYRQIYNEGVILLESGNYEEAVDKFNEIPHCEDYRDVAELLDLEQICPTCGAVLED